MHVIILWDVNIFLDKFHPKRNKCFAGTQTRARVVFYGLVQSPNKRTWAADFPFVPLSSNPIVTHSAWLSRSIHSALSLPISRCNKTQQLLLWGTPKGILWGRWESQAEWQPMPQPIFTLSWPGRGGEEVEGVRLGCIGCLSPSLEHGSSTSPPFVEMLTGPSEELK